MILLTCSYNLLVDIVSALFIDFSSQQLGFPLRNIMNNIPPIITGQIKGAINPNTNAVTGLIVAIKGKAAFTYVVDTELIIPAFML